MRIRKQRLLGLMVLSAMWICFFLPVKADSGPKPSLTIQCEGFEENAYITVLSTVKEYGPNVSMEALDYEIREEEWFAMSRIDKEIYIAFCDEAQRIREGGEELYFYGVVSECADDYVFSYWPPQEFRVLVWLKDSNQFILSEKTYTREAFQTVLKCSCCEDGLVIRDISQTGISFAGILARILLTIAVEYAIGMIFIKYTLKSSLAVIGVNIVTQILLNVCLHAAALKFGYGMPVYLCALPVLEILIILAEWLAYRKLIPENCLSSPFWYSVLANCLSYGAGLMASSIFPVLFQ